MFCCFLPIFKERVETSRRRLVVRIKRCCEEEEGVPSYIMQRKRCFWRTPWGAWRISSGVGDIYENVQGERLDRAACDQKTKRVYCCDSDLHGHGGR